MGACCSFMTTNSKSSTLLHAVLQKKRIAISKLNPSRQLNLSLIKNLIAGHGDEDNLGGMEYVMDESTRLQSMVFCSIFHKLHQQTYTAIIQCISILYSAPFDYTYTQNRCNHFESQCGLPPKFFGSIKGKKHDHRVVPGSCFSFCGKEKEDNMRIPHLFLILLLTLFFALVTIKLSIIKEQSSMSTFTRVSKVNFFDWQSHVE